MKTIFYLILLTPILLFGIIQAQSAPLFQDFDQFFAQYVKEGRVDYQSIKENPQGLMSLKSKLQGFDLTALPEGPARKAFWLNAYNFLVIAGVVEHYPVSSPMDIPGFFKEAPRVAAQQNITLDQIEHQKLRAAYPDPRVHFALICAADGCPKMAGYAFLPEKLDEQLDQRTRAALNDPAFIRLDPDQKQVLVSQIFNWFAGDFLAEAPTIIAYINRFRDAPIPRDYQLRYYEYNWQLNDVARQPEKSVAGEPEQ